MAHPSELVRPVRYPGAKSGEHNLLIFSSETGMIIMDPVNLDELGPTDFKRIHQFWDRLQRSKRGTNHGQR